MHCRKGCKDHCADASEEAKRAKEKFDVKIAGGLLGVYSVYKGKRLIAAALLLMKAF